MKIYILKKKNKNRKIIKLNFKEDGYLFKPNIKNPDLIKITNLSLFNLKDTSPILQKKMNASFRKIASLVYPIINDEDATEGDIAIALDEIAKQKQIIINKYKQYIKKQEYDKGLKRLKILEVELKEKLIIIENYKEEKEERHSR